MTFLSMDLFGLAKFKHLVADCKGFPRDSPGHLWSPQGPAAASFATFNLHLNQPLVLQVHQIPGCSAFATWHHGIHMAFQEETLCDFQDGTFGSNNLMKFLSSRTEPDDEETVDLSVGARFFTICRSA